MKKTLVTLGALAIFAAVALTVQGSSEKVKINHKGKIIEVPPQAVPAHLGHGDFIVGGDGSSSEGSAADSGEGAGQSSAL